MLGGNERAYVLDCLESGWISGSGKYVEMLEEQFASFCGASHAVAVANGTAALHVALLSLGVGPGDEVIVPDLTFIATANAVTYCGARPVFCDVDAATWTMSVEDAARKITDRTSGVIPVHLYGHPADMGAIAELAKARGLFVLEDAAEAHGAEYRGRRVGALGDAATFSFYGNKIITTGEGGIVTTNDAALARRARLLRGQGMDPERRYWFPIIGYNYRLTNVQAAIGLAQFERIDWLIERRREVAGLYAEALRGLPLSTPVEESWAKNVYWLYSVVVAEGIDRDLLMRRLLDEGIETRPFFYPLHSMPPYRAGDQSFPVTERLAARGLSLPSSASLSGEDIDRVAGALRRLLEQ